MTPCGIFMKSELVVVISTTFASWHIFTRHNALWLFKNSHNPQFRAVAVSLMPQRVVVFFPLSELFRSLSLTSIYNYITNPPTCFGASVPISGSFDSAFAKVMKY